MSRKSTTAGSSSTSKKAVPAGRVLVTFWADWFSHENGYTAHAAGTEVETAKFTEGQAKLLADGQSLEVVSKIRNDPDRHAWTIENRRITNKGGQIHDEFLRSAVVMG